MTALIFTNGGRLFLTAFLLRESVYCYAHIEICIHTHVRLSNRSLAIKYDAACQPGVFNIKLNSLFLRSIIKSNNQISLLLVTI